MDAVIGWSLLLLLVCSSIVISYYIFLNRVPQIDKDMFEKTSREKMVYEIDNGDVLLFSGITDGEKFMKGMTYSPWTHIGFVFKEKEIDPKSGAEIEKAYIFECDLGQRYKDSVRLMPLDEKLTHYKGEKCVCWLKLKTVPPASRPPIDQIMINVRYFLSKNEPMDFHLFSWMFSGNKYTTYVSKLWTPKRRFCSDLIASLLKKLQILKRVRPSVSYSPHDWLLNRVELEDGYSYSSAKLVEL